MKSSCWIVELYNPLNLEEMIWTDVDQTLEKLSNKWKDHSGNDFLNYTRLHNIFHNRNKSDTLLIKVKKVQTAMSNVNLNSSG
tara:strand:- start:181 stop:429 length:249 start_codon:yes stop_codon:yes gene_type:complete